MKMKRLALIVSLLLLLMGCESDFDKCIKTNQAKLQKELSIDDIDVFEGVDVTDEEATSEWENRWRNVFPKEVAESEAVYKKWSEADCPIYGTNNKIEYERDTECFQLIADQSASQEKLLGMIKQVKLDDAIQESATEICNSQGLYE